MQIEITIKNFDHTDAIDEMIHQKSQKITRHLYHQNDANLNWTCFSQGHEMVSEAKLFDGKSEVFAKASDKNLYHTFDMVIDNIKEQLAKRSDQDKNHIHR